MAVVIEQANSKQEVSTRTYPKLRTLHPDLMKVRSERYNASMKGIPAIDRTNDSKLGIVERTEVLTQATDVDGLVNEWVFDPCLDDAFISFSQFGNLHPIFNLLEVFNSGVDYERRGFITGYDSPAADATNGVITNFCASGNGARAFDCEWECDGWTVWRRSTEVLQLTQMGQRWCENQPFYLIDGSRITNDYDWARHKIGGAAVHDFHRLLISGTVANTNETDGILAQVNYGKLDAASGNPCPANDSLVIDLGGQALCPDGGLTLVTINGVAITDGYHIIDLIVLAMRQVKRRIKNSSLTGDAPMYALIPSEVLDCLISCYVCYYTCASSDTGATTFRDNQASIALRASLLESFVRTGAVTLNFLGVGSVMFLPYDYELYDSVTGEAEIVFLTPRVGSNRLIELQFKDFRRIPPEVMDNMDKKFVLTDGGRFLRYKVSDHTCFQENIHTEFRLCMPGSFAQFRISGVLCDQVIPFSLDPKTADYLGILGAPGLEAAPTTASHHVFA